MTDNNFYSVTSIGMGLRERRGLPRPGFKNEHYIRQLIARCRNHTNTVRIGIPNMFGIQMIKIRLIEELVGIQMNSVFGRLVLKLYQPKKSIVIKCRRAHLHGCSFVQRNMGS